MAYKYIDIPLNINKVDALIRDENVVVQRVKLLLTTEPGDFIDIPNYGTPIRQYLYEFNSETENLLKMTIRHSLNKWLSNEVQLDNIRVLNKDHEVVIELELFLLEFNKTVGYVQNFMM